MKNKFYFFLLTSAVMMSLILYTLGQTSFTFHVIVYGIVFLTLVTLFTFLFTASTIHHENPNKFVRTVMGATMIKFFLCIAGIAAMVMVLGKSLHKPDVFLLMAIYMYFTIGEALFLSKMTRKK